MNPFLERKFLTSNDNSCLNIKFSFTGCLLISRYLYFILNSSPPSDTFSRVKGGTRDLFKIFILDTRISISPVLIFSLIFFLSITFPSTSITNSLPSSAAAENNSSLDLSLSNTNCVMPYLSLKSTQIINPFSLTLFTQPESLTF